MRICSIYFSGTGITEKVVCTISTELKDSISRLIEKNIELFEFDFTPVNSRKDRLSFSREDIVVIGVPTIAGRVPNLLLKYLNSIEGNGAICIPVVTFGNRNFDDSLVELSSIMKERGFNVIAAAAFVGEHSFSRILGGGRPDSRDIDLIKDFACKVAQKLNDLNIFEYLKFEDSCSFDGKKFDFEKNIESIELNELGSIPFRNYFTPRDRYGNKIDFISIKPKTDMNLCDDCKVCYELCPLGSIEYDDVSNVSGKCMKCCACTKKCPKGAKYFDDEGYIYHMKELEDMYMERKEPKIFL